MKKSTKRTIIGIILLIFIFVGLYFLDKDVFINLKDSLIKDIGKIVNK